MFPEKPGVMASRELTADDVVFSYNRLANSPKKIATYFDHVEKVDAPDKHTVVFTLQGIQRRVGLPLRLGLLLRHHAEGSRRRRRRQLEERQRHRPVHARPTSCRATPTPTRRTRSTGTRRRSTATSTSCRSSTRSSTAPSRTRRRTSPRCAPASSTSWRTIRWQNVEQLKKSAPQLQWSKWLNMSGTFLAMRVDTKPFDDIRVRRALNMAVNKQEIVKAYYNGNAELFAYPQHPDYSGYFEPLEAMPDSVKELFTYDPAKAKKLLAEAGLSQRLHLQGAGLRLQPRPHGPAAAGRRLPREGRRQDRDPAHGVRRVPLGHDARKTNAPGYFMNNGHTNPTTTIRKSFVYGQVWNPSQYNDPAYEKKMDRRLSRARRGQAPGDAQGDDARDPRQGALHLAADAATSSRRGGRG